MSSRAVVIGLVLAALPIAMIGVSAFNGPSEAETQAKYVAEIRAGKEKAAREAAVERALMSDPKTAAILKAERAKEAAFKGAKRMDATVQVALATRVRDSMKNPASFSLVEALEIPGDTQTLCMTYRATNSFNAVITDRIAVTSRGVQAPWDKACAGKTGWDVTFVLKHMV